MSTDTWEKINSGPTRINVNLDSEELCSAFADNWITSVQSVQNLIAILAKIVEKNNISNSIPPETPCSHSLLYYTGTNVIEIHDILKKIKPIIFFISNVKRDWVILVSLITQV